jgi:hypothetical protein
MHDTIPSSYLEESYDSSIQITFKTGVFYTKKDEVSTAGKELMYKQAGMDILVPLVYNSDSEFLYAGFETDEILYIYPGYKVTEETSPYNMEWYYRAVANPGEIIMTEPFIDANSNRYMVSISTGMMNDSSVIGAISSDISLEKVRSKLESQYIKNGFILLISKNGLLVKAPSKWYLKSESIRVFDTKYTGITNSTWNDIKDLTIPIDKRMSFIDANSTEYYFVRSFVQPYKDIEEITHYILVCVEKDELLKPVSELERSFESLYKTIFYVTVSISAITFLAIFLCISLITLKLKNKFNCINRAFTQLFFRSTYVKITRSIKKEDLLQVDST